LSQAYKLCPICGTPSHRNASICSTCGTTLNDVPVINVRDQAAAELPNYDRRYGETDLLEGDLRRRGPSIAFGVLIALGLLVCGGLIVALASQVLGGAGPSVEPTSAAPTAVPTRDNSGAAPAALATNTQPAAPALATVTPAPPSATPTPTQGPCMHQVQSGEDLISIAVNCGHRDMDVIPLILEINGLSAPEMIQAGQVLEIPWPTPTLDPNAGSASESDAASSNPEGAADAQIGSAETNVSLSAAAAPTDSGPTPMPTETMLPGVMWHTVLPNENMVAIAYQYNTNAEVLSQLNPEITFSQCDYSLDTGGPRCVVLLQQGQRMRVPAPTPTPTLSPTPSGSETPTPSPTPTFNAPSVLSPSNRTLFQRDDIITLRWVASGTLSGRDVYRVRIEDLTAGTIYTDDTAQLSYIVPQRWQGLDSRRHEYRWSVSVVNLDQPDQPYFTTEARLFTWEGRGVSN